MPRLHFSLPGVVPVSCASNPVALTQVVHIDLGVAFDLGKVLKTPEIGQKSNCPPLSLSSPVTLPLLL